MIQILPLIASILSMSKNEGAQKLGGFVNSAASFKRIAPTNPTKK